MRPRRASEESRANAWSAIAWRAIIIAVGVAVTVGCGGRSPEPSPTMTAAAISAVAPPVGGDDLVVATVNDRPVWGSCVAAQATRDPGAPRDRRAALDECIAFELLAQAAEARGLAAAPEVVDATRTALVSRLVASFEDSHADPAALGARMTALLDRNAWRLRRPAARASTYVRIDVPGDASPAQETHARETIERIAAALAHETGLTGVHLVESARQIEPSVRTENVKALPASMLEPAYAAALFSIPEVGRVSGPVRTTWGWDVIVLTADEPARDRTRDELAREIFPELRRQLFQIWVNAIVRDRGVQIAVDTSQLEGLAP